MNLKSKTQNETPSSSLAWQFSSFLTVLFLALVGCEPPEIGTGTTQVDSSNTGNATLRISNRIVQNPSRLTFFLFNKDAVDIVNATAVKRIGEVDTGATVVFQVPAGDWKIAYEDKLKALFPMKDEGSGGQEWLKSTFNKDGDYALILNSDANRTLWVPNYTTTPAMSR